MYDELKGNLKLLLHVSKVLHPKHHAVLFIIYMYLIYYYRTAKRKLKYNLKCAGDEIILHHTRNHFFFNDINNVVLVNKQNLYKNDKLLKLISENNTIRYVYVVSQTDIAQSSLLMNDALFQNIGQNASSIRVQLQSHCDKLVKLADKIDVSLIAPTDLGSSICQTILGKYFNTPKLVAKGDIIAIDVKYFAEDLFYNNTKMNNVHKIFFKCNRVFYGGIEDENMYFCGIGETSITQSANVQNFLPKKINEVIYNRRDNKFREIPVCPYGLKDYLDELQLAVKPFFTKRKLNLKPVFLIQGVTGSGKETLLNCLACQLGVQFHKVNNSDLMANVYAQNETKLRNALFNAKMGVPGIIAIFNFENFGKNNDGQYDERLIGNFSDELKCLFNDNKFPLILFCSTTTDEIPSYLKKHFLQTFKIDAPTCAQREENLKWIIEQRGLETNVPLCDIANKTHGFLFEDLKALVYYAEQEGQKQGAHVVELLDENFNSAINYMQANYNESLGAPKVPKVQWSDIGGLTDVKEEIIKTINLPLKHPEFVKKSGLRRSGILLFGPPGTGKTLIAKAVATECSLCFLSVKGPELLNMYVGQSEQNIREVFVRARQASPCIIFFDELDSLAPNRGMSGDSGGVMDRVVSQLLAEMDGLNESATIFIIGATNRPDLIDPALLRPGRFDKLLYVGACTDAESKLSVLEALTRKFHLSEDLKLEEVVSICPKNITGADFYGICSNAWNFAVRKVIQKIELGQADVKEIGSQNVIVGIEDFKTAIRNVKPSISEDDLRYFEKLKVELSSTPA